MCVDKKRLPHNYPSALRAPPLQGRLLEGFASKMLIKKLLKNHVVDYIGSDMHCFRPTHLVAALEKIKDSSNINKDIFNLN